MPLGLRCLVLGRSCRLVRRSPFCRDMELVLSGLGGREKVLQRRRLRCLALVLQGRGICLCLKMIRRLRNRLLLLKLEYVKGSNSVRLVVLRRELLLEPILLFCLDSILCKFFHRCCLGIFFCMCYLDIELLGFYL